MNSSQVAPLAGMRFAPVRLAPAQVAAYERMLHSQLAHALREYDAAYARGLGAAGGAQLTPPWKSAGTVGRLATFKLATTATGSDGGGAALQAHRTFGQVQGFYRDILDAHRAESSTDLRDLQKLLYPDTLDAAVLHTIRSDAAATQQQQQPSYLPTQDMRHEQQWTAVREQYFGIKWVATSSPSADVRKRDCCYVEMLGYTSDRSGREVAFCTSASVALPECPDLHASHQLMRFRMRNTMLVAPTQDAHNTSEIFVTGVKEVADASLGTNAHHRHAMAILNDMSLVIDSRKLAKQSLLPRARWVPDRARSNCSVCCRGFSFFFFRRRHHCRLCGEVICRTCYVKRCVPSSGAGSRRRNHRSAGARGGGGGSEMAEDKFCVRCIVGLRAADRYIETFSQQIHKVNSLRVLGRDSSISSDIGVSFPVFNSGSSQLSSLSSSSEIIGGASESSSFATGGSGSSSIVYYQRGSRKKRILRLDDLIKLPVESPEDDTDLDDESDAFNRVEAKRVRRPVRLLSNDASMVELYNRLVRLSHSSTHESRTKRREREHVSTGSASIEELRRSFASQELLQRQLCQGLLTP